MNKPATIGHNRPPNPIDDALAAHGDTIAEAEAWLDGQAVETEGAMKAVDTLLAGIKAAIKDVSAGEESEAKPLYDDWKRTKERWKPTLDDLDRIKRGLVALVDGFKRKLAAEKAEAERKAWKEAEAKRLAAEEAARAANVADIESQRAAAAAMAEAAAADKALAAARKGKVTGLRDTDMYAIDDRKAALHWIAREDRDAVTAFVDEYVRRNFRERPIDGVRTWREKVAI